ncbi:MAG: serine/threonine-protein phosphatase [Burkholderiales bacterium]|nr:serine/threonine-protein phosphatase [Anaerolineae bacterium]
MNIIQRLFGQSDKKGTSKSAEETSSAAANSASRSTSDAPRTDERNVDTDRLPADVVMPASAKSTATASLYVDGATRPLPAEVVIAAGNKHIIFGQSTDVGMVRNNNQDAAYSFFTMLRSVDDYPDFGLFIVADGMGGHHDGEKASAMTARIVAAQVASTIYQPLLAGIDSNDRPPITEALIEAVQKANASVIAKVPDGGTTLTAVAIVGDLAYIAHVGDSRIYLITRDGVEQITRDHSLVQRLIELDQLTPEEAAEHPQKNVLYRALGQNEALEVDALTRRLPPNSKLLLCSDGLWSQVQEREIAQIVRNNPDPQEACDQLVALANTHGGIDNVTAILLQVPGS